MRFSNSCRCGVDETSYAPTGLGGSANLTHGSRRGLPSYAPTGLGSCFRGGFSLIEVMIVVVIIGLMAGVVTYATTGYLERAKKERARADISTYATAVDSYYLAKGKLPDTQEGLKVLVPDFVKGIQNDPWGHAYQYLKPGRNSPYEIVSYGADGREGGSGADADILASEIQAAKSK